MKGKKLNIDQCVNALSKKRVEIDLTKRKVDVSKARSLGNKSWGMIDFLCNYCGYSLSGISNYGRKKI